MIALRSPKAMKMVAGATDPGCHGGRYLIVGVGYIRPAGRIYATPTARRRAAPGFAWPVVRGDFRECPHPGTPQLRNLGRSSLSPNSSSIMLDFF